MSHVVCLLNVEADRATFTWSEGPAAFEPYTLEGMVFNECKELTGTVRQKLADLINDYLHCKENVPRAAYELAEAGFELYEALFDPGAEQQREASQVRKWLEKLATQHEVDTLEMVVESPWSFPLNLIYDREPDEDAFLNDDDSGDRWRPFWGLRFNLCGGRKVDPLRRMPVLKHPKVLMVVDPEIRDGLPRAQQQRIVDFAEKHSLKVVNTQDELKAAMKAERPDLLYWLSHASPEALILSDEPVSPRTLRKLLKQDDEEELSFGGLAFLNACQTAESSAEEGSFFEAFHSVGFAGMIGTEHQTIDQFASRLGLDFLEAFLERGESAGSALRKLRARVPLGLLYGAYCPPNIRIDNVAAGESIDIQQGSVIDGRALAADLLAAAEADEQAAPPVPLPALPAEPYRSLSNYERKDRALFAGRDDDIERFARILDDTGTRMLVLHGESGVGKSSFLHAGVIPFLEEECLGYRFVRQTHCDEVDQSEAHRTVLFVRATNDLFGQLAHAICNFCDQPYEYQTPLGDSVSADLPGVLRELVGEEISQATVRAVLRSDVSLLGKTMAMISDRLPFAPILVIDQGEEIFTLAQAPEDRQRGQRALQMLRQMVQAPGDFKVLFSLRTEYYGRLIDRLRRGLSTTGGIREYLLTDFEEADVLEAIQRPTGREPIPYTSEVPYEKYGFRYADGVAEEIAHRVMRYSAQGRDSVLPLVQVICAQLYELARQRAECTITSLDLEALGGIEGGMRNHVEGLLNDFLKGHGSDKRPVKRLFTQLYLRQPDGTLTTALLAEDEVERRWKGRMPFDALLRGSQAIRLLKVNSMRISFEEERRYVSLGHDALAKIAAKWDEELSRGARMRKLAAALAVIGSVAVGALALAAVAVFFAIQAQRAQIRAVNQEVWVRGDSSIHVYEAERPFDALLAAVEAGRRFRDINPVDRDAGLREHIESALIQALSGVTRKNTWKAHSGWPNTLVANSDGSRLVSAGYDRTIRRWLPTGESLSDLTGHQQAVFALAISPDDKILASGDGSGAVKFWQDPSAETISAPSKTITAHQGAVRALAFHPSGRFLVSGGDDGTIHFWTPQGDHHQESPGKMSSEDPVTSLAFGRDGKLLLSGHGSGALTWWIPNDPATTDLTITDPGTTDAPTGDAPAGTSWQAAKTSTEHSDAVLSLSFDSRGASFASAGKDGAVRVWSEADELQQTYAGTSPVHVVRFGLDDALFAVNADRRLRVWRSGGGFSELIAHDEPIMGLAFAQQGELAATVSRDLRIRIWQAAKNRFRIVLTGHAGPCHEVDVSPDGKLIASAGDDATVRLWSIDGALLKTLAGSHDKLVRSVRFSRDSKRLVSAGHDGRAIIWRVPEGELERVLPVQAAGVNQGDFSPDGTQVVVGGLDGKINLWSVESGELIKSFPRESSFIDGVRVSSDGTVAVSLFSPAVVRLYSMDGTPRQPAILDDYGDCGGSHSDVIRTAFSPDGRWIATAAGGGDGYLWARDGNCLKALMGHGRGVNFVDFSPDSRWLITAGFNGQIRIWHAPTGELYRTLRGHHGGVTSAVFTKQGWIVSSSADSTIMIWKDIHLTFDDLMEEGERWIEDYERLGSAQ